MKNKKIVSNTAILMIFNIAKMVFPFLTLPYLTRVFSTETYGTVAYVKTVMTYMQIIVDFGFVLSATKDVVKAKDNNEELQTVINDTMMARVMMGVIGFFAIIILSFCLPILRNNLLYTLLSYLVVFLSIFLMDFLFRGLEIMHIITVRFITMKLISTIMTFLLVKNDSHMLLIPVLDILSSIIAVGLVFYNVKKRNLKIGFSNIKKSLKSIKDSFVYFLSDVASTSFNALSTIIIGMAISTTEVAYWSVCMQIIGSIQACYTPISGGIYPEMIKTKNYALIKKVIKIFLPIVILGCIFVFFAAEWIFNILGGKEYLVAVPIFRILIPTLFFGFLAIIYGWSALGAIGKTKEATFSTIFSVSFNVILMIGLLITNKFTLMNIAIVRSLTEIILFSTRYCFCRKYRNLFN